MKNFFEPLRLWHEKRHTLALDDLVHWLKWEIRALDSTFLLPGDSMDDDACISVVADLLIGASTEDAAQFVTKHQARIEYDYMKDLLVTIIDEYIEV